MAERIVFGGVAMLRDQVTKQMQARLCGMLGTNKAKAIAVGLTTYKVGCLIDGRSKRIPLEDLLRAASRIGINIVGEVRV